jgi:endonuclease/exonuclease/phosphatase family metal-dependent hydrolase
MKLAPLLLAPALAALVTGCGPTGDAIAEAEEFAKALPAGAIRVATFNCSLNRPSAGELIADLSTPDDAQAQATAEVVQRVRPDVLLLQEFDYDADGKAAQLFRDGYLAVGQRNQKAIDYPYWYAPAVNTGVDSGHDLDNDGELGGPGDGHGFGEHPGQFGFVVYSRYPIDAEQIRTFQHFLWQDMPGAMLPEGWYDGEELATLRLSSKNHVDVPVLVDGTVVHVLADHPTPPAFDGPEDRNGKRNHDEIRLWADYLTPGKADYLVDDAGERGGLAEGERFVILGDHNADPIDGAAVPGAIAQILEHERVNRALTPWSTGARTAAKKQGGVNADQEGDPGQDTGDFFDGVVGNLRLDYVLPATELEMLDARVFWPQPWSSLHFLIEHSDHRLTWIDVQVHEP